ncbi:hypothetical protein FZ934_23900 (plasmid) [Rhizobium grahamii]|uniref:CENP-V/GFA domain-containing protein n=1 Tax=Rhizobium grahamii TaxID=1120045 RepID=A0A5Q0CBR5_9HYPH|nr:hypothetical protein FZ934_23900 [Rhizobium grahamii]QRM51907.1 hypothetical protein F3Y33_21750 [Rhizobium sp. BG6]
MTPLATCCCGELSATTNGPPAMVALCHCRSCQRRTGSAFDVHVLGTNSASVSQESDRQLAECFHVAYDPSEDAICRRDAIVGELGLHSYEFAADGAH